MFSKGVSLINKSDIEHIPQESLSQAFLGISSIPCLICSPLRIDRKPSLSIFYGKDGAVMYKDFSTGDSGNIYTLLSKLWSCSMKDVYERIADEFKNTLSLSNSIARYNPRTHKTSIEVRFREWEEDDLAYWSSYGVNPSYLQWAQVYPISHSFTIKDGKIETFVAPKYAYVFVEYYEGEARYKIYKPFAEKHKWLSNFNSNIISLYDRIPPEGDKIVICSSLKDSLCVISQLGIPAIAPQGEGYSLHRELVEDLKRRFKKVYVMYDNDAAGILNMVRIQRETGFSYIIPPSINGAKDVSDFYKSLEDKSEFKAIMGSMI